MTDIRANAAEKRAEKEEVARGKAEVKEAKEAKKARGINRLAEERRRMELEDEEDEENYRKSPPARDEGASDIDDGEQEEDAMDVDDGEEAPKKVST